MAFNSLKLYFEMCTLCVARLTTCVLCQVRVLTDPPRHPLFGWLAANSSRAGGEWASGWQATKQSKAYCSVVVVVVLFKYIFCIFLFVLSLIIAE